MKPMKVSAVKATEYYYQADPLYSLDGDHKWIGSGAKNLGLTGNIDYDKFTNLLNGMAPDGSKRLAGREADHGKYAAIDMPISIPKSFSILAMVDPEFRAKLTETLISSAENVGEYVYGRQTANGVTEQVKGGMIGAAFVHSTSRAGDPNFHCHTVVANVVQRPDGTFSTLENREIFVNQGEHQQRVYSDLASMAHKMGYATELSTNKGGLVVPEISGVGKDINDQFSKRHEEIRNATELRAGIKERMPGLSEIEVDGLVQLHTKAAKDKDLSGDELNKSFQTQLKGLGTSADEILSSAKMAGSERVQSDLTARDFVKMAAGDLAEQESVTSEKNILAMATKLSTGVCVREDLQGAFRESVKSGDIVDLGKGGFTTPEIQKIEHHIATVAVEQAHAFKPLLDKAGALDAITVFEAAKGFKTTAGQAAAIEYTLTGEGRLLVIQGDAGAGKSTAFDAINRALEGRDDVTVRGLGFQGKAAAGLESSSGIKSGTIDGFLLSRSDWDGQSRQLWVVDEASMASSKHLGALMTRAENENAQIVLVGDAKQIASIGAGKLFQDLQDHGLVNTAIMDEVRRQKTDYTIDVATALKKHDIKSALDILDNRGNIFECAENGDRITRAANLYVERDEVIAITVTNRERLDLIQEIRALEKASGKIGTEDHIYTTREPVNIMGAAKRFASSYEPGNSVFIQQNIEGLIRGSELQIVAADTAKNRLTVQNDKGDLIEIDTLKNGDKISQFQEAQTAFSEGEKVIWTKNDNTDFGKQHGLMNGVTGVISEIKDGIATIKTENGDTIQQRLEGAYITNAQAITINKSQGLGERDVIAVLSSDAPAALLDENKFYTALTRMTHNIFAVTDDKNKLLEAVSNPQEKTSTLDHADELLAGLKARQAAEQNINDMPGGWKENHVAADEKSAVVIEDKMQDKSNEQQQQRAQIQMSM